LAWVGLCTLAGYFFGNVPIVKKNFELVVVGIVLMSVLPVAWELLAARRRRSLE
jgi:membrane-associated protein